MATQSRFNAFQRTGQPHRPLYAAPVPSRKPAAAAAPKGKLMPGRSSGSMVWVPDAPSAPAASSSTPSFTPMGSVPQRTTQRPAQRAPFDPLGPVPLLDQNPVNGGLSKIDGMPRGQFFGDALKKGKGGGGMYGGSVPVYNDIRDSILGKAPRTDPRSYGTGGKNFTGPMMPLDMEPQAMNTPLPFGGFRADGGPVYPGEAYVVGEEAPEFFVPDVPGQIVPMGQMPFGMGAPSPGKGPVPMGQPALPPPSLDRARPSGRSANDPMRIAEQMRRRGDPRAILRFGEMQMGQAFAREQNAVNFEQGKMMFGMQQGAMDARDQRNFEQGQMMFGMQQGAMDARDERNFTQQQQLEQQRRRAEQAARDAERNRKPNVDFTPIPGTGYGIPIADGRAMGTLPMQQQEPVWAGTNRPAFPKSGPAPKVEKPQTPSITWLKDANGSEVPYQTIVDSQGRASLRRVSIDDRTQQQQTPPGGGAAPAAAPQPKGTTVKGSMWSLAQ